jgi:hypothetical protein
VNEFGSTTDRGGDVVSFSTPPDVAKASAGGRYWRFRVVSNHGNGSYSWFCEFRMCVQNTQNTQNKTDTHAHSRARARARAHARARSRDRACTLFEMSTFVILWFLIMVHESILL